MSSDKPYMARVQSMPRYYLDGLVRELSTKNVFLFAQAIAFKVLVTIVPIVILVTGLLGNVLRYQEPYSTVSRFVRGLLPPYQSQQVLDFLGAFQGSSGAFLSVGTVGLLLTAMTLATTVRLAVASAFQQEWNEYRPLLRGYAFDLRMVVQVGLLFLMTVGLSFLVQALNNEGLELMQAWGLEDWLRAGWRSAFNALTLVVPLLVSAVMFFQLFYFVPIPHPPRTSAFIGAFVTAVLWEAAKYGFALYATYVGTFNYQSAADGVGAVTGGFGLLIVFVLWIYYSGIVLMVGAVIASLHEQRRRIRLEGGRSVAPGSKLDAAARQRVGETDAEIEAAVFERPYAEVETPSSWPTAQSVAHASLERAPSATPPPSEDPATEEDPTGEDPDDPGATDEDATESHATDEPTRDEPAPDATQPPNGEYSDGMSGETTAPSNEEEPPAKNRAL